ncbi:MarR family winged helix-turn-helix transcriptional regulator [Mycolicibacterium sp.]|uniref:MarR family winged helix-turn-helix transcriptional regulator n=1 Tax=Mycolicibacterium sp. TaxID=2320850 RepID=UPI001A19C3F3|nr:MarR family winged helix-turn-helix transcriptional regulator [Mycolicibacterium sp.]MBJ7340364.1 winged helix-turn-helix transcriptional regulator [Mycolicibacterium sp.]
MNRTAAHASTTERESALADLADAIMHAARLIRSWDQTAETVVPLSMIEAAVLEYVDRHPGCRPSDVAHELRMRSSNFSAALRVLEKQEFIERRGDPSDGRTANLFVTALAKRNIDIVRSRRAALLADSLGNDSAGVDAARDLLDRLRHTPRENSS